MPAGLRDCDETVHDVSVCNFQSRSQIDHCCIKVLDVFSMSVWKQRLKKRRQLIPVVLHCIVESWIPGQSQSLNMKMLLWRREVSGSYPIHRGTSGGLLVHCLKKLTYNKNFAVIYKDIWWSRVLFCARHNIMIHL